MLQNFNISICYYIYAFQCKLLPWSNYFFNMGRSNDLFIENVLLKNIDEYIPINIDLSTIPEKNSASTVRRISTTISKTKRYINQMYDETVRSELRKEILIELRQRFLAEKKKENEPFEKFLQSLNNQISTLKS